MGMNIDSDVVLSWVVWAGVFALVIWLDAMVWEWVG